VRELSGGAATSLSAPPAETLAALAAEDPAHMKVDELCALAAATFQGVPGVLEADPGKAVALWRVAAARGSLDATYSLAVCLRDGKGAEKDSEAAHGMLLTLAKEHNYNMAHVRPRHSLPSPPP
jgi:TPR repeat protein